MHAFAVNYCIAAMIRVTIWLFTGACNPAWKSQSYPSGNVTIPDKQG